MEYVLKIENLYKKFNDTVVLDNVNFNLKKGEIHGVIGANGSGKSTLMNILSGSSNISSTGGYRGNIYIEEAKVEITGPLAAREHGIGMVHQELSLFQNLSVSNNIKINKEHTYSTGRLFKKFALVDDKSNRTDAEIALTKLGVDINTKNTVDKLSSNLRQFVEIAREIDNDNLKILMLDEPTSSLNVEETKLLLEHLKMLAESGISIIFVSHRLEEIQSICHRVTVLRDGVLINTYEKPEIEINKLALDMVGTEVAHTLRAEKDKISENILTFNNVNISRSEGEKNKVSLEIKKGEILGITGLAGHGQELFGYGLMGLCEMNGEIIFEGKRINPGDAEAIYKSGIFLLPDNRKEMGLLLDRPLWENIVAGTYDKRNIFLKCPKLKSFSFLNHKEIFSHSDRMLESLNIKASSINQPVRELSGGNQQKICIARAITAMPELLFVGEPTRGIDIYSKEIILGMLLKMNEENNTTIVISSVEIGELKRVCDRIAIMYENKVFDIFEKDFDSERFNLAVSGRRVSE